MRTVIGLIVMVTIVLGAMAGCGTTPSEQVYRDVTVGSMTVSIPDDWQRPEDYSEAEAAFLASFTEEEVQAVDFDAYGDESANSTTALVTMDMVKWADLEGSTWIGWEALMEATDMTKEDYLASFGAQVFGECTQTLAISHTIQGKEAIEGQFEGTVNGMPSIVKVLMLFPENDLGLVMLVVKETSAEEFKGTWEEIRDSAQFSY
jgi:hypothetical protein